MKRMRFVSVFPVSFTPTFQLLEGWRREGRGRGRGRGGRMLSEVDLWMGMGHMCTCALSD